MKVEVVRVECRCRNCRYAEYGSHDGYPREVKCRVDGNFNSIRDIDDFCSKGKWNGEE